MPLMYLRADQTDEKRVLIGKKKKIMAGGSTETKETQTETNTKHTLKYLTLVEMKSQKGKQKTTKRNL